MSGPGAGAGNQWSQGSKPGSSDRSAHGPHYSALLLV